MNKKENDWKSEFSGLAIWLPPGDPEPRIPIKSRSRKNPADPKFSKNFLQLIQLILFDYDQNILANNSSFPKGYGCTTSQDIFQNVHFFVKTVLGVFLVFWCVFGFLVSLNMNMALVFRYETSVPRYIKKCQLFKKNFIKNAKMQQKMIMFD